MHAGRRYAEDMPDDHVIVNLDFSNAFNSLPGDAMLKAIADRVSSIYRFCHLSYSQLSILKFNNHRIMSEEWPQQGDPLGGLLFCNTIHTPLSQMKAALVEGYMNDIILGGTRNDVATYVIKIRSEGGTLSLQLNANKCELIQHSSTRAEPAFQDFVIMTPDKASLLGARLTEGHITHRRSLHEMRRTQQSHRQVDPATCTRRIHPSEIILQCTEDNEHAPLFPMFPQRSSGSI